MKKLATLATIAGMTVAGFTAAHASSMPFTQYAVGVNAGTTGIGGTVTTDILPGRINLNLGFSGFGKGATIHADGVRYHGDVRLGGGSAILAFYPFKDYGFNLDAGMFINRMRVLADGRPDSGSSYTINGNQYTAAQVGSLHGQTHYRTVDPYFGVGWGNPIAGNSNWTFMFNAGVIDQGNADTSLDATGAANNPKLASDIEAQRHSLNHELHWLGWYPVVTLGVSYRF